MLAGNLGLIMSGRRKERGWKRAREQTVCAKITGRFKGQCSLAWLELGGVWMEDGTGEG